MTVTSAGPIRFDSVSNVTATRGPKDPEVGTVVEEGNHKYVYVYNAGNSQISVGRLAVMSGVSGYSVTVSSVTGVDFAVGVCKHATLTTGTYGWLMTRGFTQAQLGANDSATTGDILRLGVDGAFTLASLVTGHFSPVIGKAMTGAASATSCHAYVSIF
jgi:hypothetical protein